MERLWSQAGATSGSRSQMGQAIAAISVVIALALTQFVGLIEHQVWRRFGV